jgi:hypothetical protein
MNNIQKRFLLFLLGCIPLRIGFALIAKNYTNYLRFMSYFAIMISIGFFYIFFTGSRETGRETLGDKIWWDKLRPVHGLLYLLFAIYAFQGKKDAWIFLLIDVLLGLSSFLVFHYKEGNFSKLKK